MANEFDGWHDRVYGDIELSYPPGEGKWHGDTYIFFHCRSTGFNGEVWGHAAMVLHAYMTGPWWPLIEPRLKQCGNHMGGDMSHQILALFKEDEQDRIDMQVMQMEAWLEKQRKITETGQRIVREMMSNLCPEIVPELPPHKVEDVLAGVRDLKQAIISEHDAKRELGDTDRFGFVHIGTCDETCDMIEGTCMHYPHREQLIFKIKSLMLKDRRSAWDLWVEETAFGRRPFSDRELVQIGLTGQLPKEETVDEQGPMTEGPMQEAEPQKPKRTAADILNMLRARTNKDVQPDANWEAPAGESKGKLSLQELAAKFSEQPMVGAGPEPENVPETPVKVQSGVWHQRLSGSKNTVPKPLPTTSFMTPGSRLKSSDG